MKQDNGKKTVQTLAVAVIALGGGLIYWQYNLRSGAEARLAKVKSETPDQKQVEQDLAQSRIDVAKYSVDLQHLEQGVPTNAYVATLLKELETLGFQKQLVVTGVRPVISTVSAPPPTTKGSAVPAAKPYDELDIDITGRGRYLSVMEVVTALRAFPKIVAVKTVGLQPKNDPESKKLSLLDATISIKAYIFKEGDTGVATKDLTATTPAAPGKEPAK
ncbi:MAG: type 4a pilus biogenesis protein PilO [Armatimonadota bacterium]